MTKPSPLLLHFQTTDLFFKIPALPPAFLGVRVFRVPPCTNLCRIPVRAFRAFRGSTPPAFYRG